MTETVFWDCRGDERLTHTSPEEALIDYADACADPGETTLEWIKRVGPIEVEGYALEEIDRAFIDSLATRYTEKFLEDVDEEYGDPDGDYPVLTKEDEKQLPMLFRLLFAQVLSKARVWRCKVVERKTFSPEEVEKILREDCPEWFEEG